jgi:hypothetical protein
VEIVHSKRGINEINNAADRYAFVSEETYHIHLSSITRDDIRVFTLLIDYQKNAYQ